MRSTDPPTVIFVVVIPVLVVSLVFFTIWGLTSLWAWGRRLRLAALAAAEGITFSREVAPIAIPQIAHNPPRSVRMPENFLHGPRHGVQVFACDFRVGHGKGIITVSMVAIDRYVHDTRLLDLKRWQILTLNGWSFLIPNYAAGPLSRRKIKSAWNLLTQAATAGDLPTPDSHHTSPGTP